MFDSPAQVTTIPLRVEWIAVAPKRALAMAKLGYTEHSEVTVTPHHPAIGSPQIYKGGNNGGQTARVPRVLMWRERK